MTTEGAASDLPPGIPTPSGVAVIRPGDTLLLTFTHNLSEQDADRLKAELRPALDASVKIAVVDGASGCVVYRPVDEAQPHA